MQRWHKHQACIWGLFVGLAWSSAMAETQSDSKPAAGNPQGGQAAPSKGDPAARKDPKESAPAARQVIHVEPVSAVPVEAVTPEQPGQQPAATDPPAAAAAAAAAEKAASQSDPPQAPTPDQAAKPAPLDPPAPSLLPAQEVRTLKQFEESAFPRSQAFPLQQPGAFGMEGLEPVAVEARPSAIAPPAELTTAEARAEPLAPAQHGPPEAWLAQLVPPGLPLTWDPKLIRYLEFYRQSPYGRAIMRSWLQRMGRYQQMISEVLQQHELPQDLIYLAMVESGFAPSVTSRVGAAGIWQFMPGPGAGYGLRRDYWVDERRNPRKSTEAAARFLKELYEKLGSWELAMAAYNSGAGTVIRSIRKYNTNDYWQICQYEAGLPWETSLYVPKVMAVAIVGHNRAFFGFDDIQQDQELTAALVAVPTSITLAQVARAAGVNKAVIETLNPELRRGRTPPAEKVWVRVPRGTEERYYAGLAGITGAQARYKPYLVRLGDTVERIAEEHGMSPQSLRQVNDLRQLAELRPGLTILVAAKAAARTVATATGAADVEQECLLVPLPPGKPQQLSGRERVFYRATIGDTLAEIAHHLHVEPAELADWNGLNPDATLISGMVLQAFVKQGFDKDKVVLLDPAALQLMTAGSEAFLSAYEECNGRKRVVYTVRPGDSLSSIGSRFGLSVGSLARINRFDRRTKVEAGQKLVVYVDKQKAKEKPPAARKRRPQRAAKKPLPKGAAAGQDQAKAAASPGSGSRAARSRSAP